MSKKLQFILFQLIIIILFIFIYYYILNSHNLMRYYRWTDIIGYSVIIQTTVGFVHGNRLHKLRAMDPPELFNYATIIQAFSTILLSSYFFLD
jgi:hypothetical protein